MTYKPDSSTSLPTVSVIMNCLNGAKYLREAIDSIYAQTYKDWEIIFWDNASTDNSSDIAAGYDKRLRYFRGEKTVPLYAARNCALRQARGKYIAFLDCDDMWLPQKLAWQIPLFESDNKVGLVYSNVEILETNGSSRKMHGMLPSGKIFRQMLRHYNINIQTAVVSRAAIESLGEWFDDSLNLAGDTDLFLRIAHDWDAKYWPAVTARYREHSDNLSLKLAEDVPVEVEYVIGKFSRLYKDFIKDYDQELIYLRMRLRKGFVVYKWKSGQNSEARHMVLQYVAGMKPFVFLYLLLFFPYRTMSFLRNSILWRFAVKLYRAIVEIFPIKYKY
jgi:glycosyltransferase involved in cell wall biosynthesis